MATKKPSIQAYVSPETKKAIVKLAEQQDRSESYVAGKILDTAIFEKVVKEGEK